MKRNNRSIIHSAMIGLMCTYLFSLQNVLAETNISESYKYAWSENVSWQNWRSTNSQVTLETLYLKGYVWAENVGWIKLGVDAGGPYGNTNESDWGVNHDASGNLSGYAWSENAGWVNFNPSRGGVTISTSTNKFDGYAWGERIGWIHFQNASPRYYVMEELTGPTVTTQAVTVFGTTTATGNGNITDLGAPNPTQHGVCWSTSSNPTVALTTKTEQGAVSTTGAFNSSITGLNPGTTYHVRAYATNAGGTEYGNEVTFTTGYGTNLYVCNDGNCGGKPNCHTTIASAVAAAESGALIKVANDVTYNGGFNVSGKSLTVQGGWDKSFETPSGTTKIQGAPTVSNGSMTMQQVNIVP